MNYLKLYKIKSRSNALQNEILLNLIDIAFSKYEYLNRSLYRGDENFGFESTDYAINYCKILK